jgi:uncharacterized protein (TIGR02266 family)
MNDLRKDRRAPSSLKVKYKSATVDEFIEQFGSDISRGGIFIKTKKPLDTGALLKFEFQLQGGAAVIHGVGRVAWRRAEARARADLPAGMGIKFIKLDDQSRAVIERVEARHGTSSRFEQTDAAELAPPLSSLPPTATLTGVPTPPAPPPAPGNTNNSAARRPPPSPAAAIAKAPEPGADKPTFRPPPPAMSSIPPALADAWPSTPPKPPSGQGGRAAPMPRAALGSFSADGPRRSAPSPRNTARDASEFLASAFSVGGAGHDVRAAARVQAERARRDPESVDLANELFGDLNEAAPKPAPAANSADLDEVEHVDASMLDSLGPPSDPKPLTPQERTLADKIPSIEDLVNESASAGQSPQFQRDSSAGAAAARPVGTAQSALSSLPSPAGLPLSLALSNPPPTAAVDKGETLRPKADAPQRGPLGMLLGAALFVAIAGGVFFLTRSMHRAPSAGTAAVNASTAAANPQPSAAPPAKPAEQNPAASAKPAAPAEVPAVPVELSVTSEPRGAQLLADGKPAGTTPATLSLTAGVAVELSVHSPGYATTTQRVTPQKGTAPQSFVLAPLPYELLVTTEPAGANVHVKELSAVSPAPLTLGHLDGMVTATIDKDGYQRMSKTVRLEEFHEQGGTMRAEMSVTLSALPGGARRRPPAARAPAAPPPEPTAADAPPPVIQLKPAEPAADEPAAQKAPAPAAAPVAEAAAPAPKAEAPAPPAEAPAAPTP